MKEQKEKLLGMEKTDLGIFQNLSIKANIKIKNLSIKINEH